MDDKGYTYFGNVPNPTGFGWRCEVPPEIAGRAVRCENGDVWIAAHDG